MTVANELYPFTSRWFDRGDGIRMHYVDEGQGDPVVMVHGNPTWSFYYRDLIKALSPTHRVVAVDHIGCGLSDKPEEPRYEYTLSSRVKDLEALMDHCSFKSNVTLVVHDWGGAIGFGWATKYADRIARLVILNTAAFHNPLGKDLPKALWLARDTKFGAYLVERFNAFARGATWLAMARRKMPRDVRDGYLAPYEPATDRLATLRFVQDIPLGPEDKSFPVITEMQDRLHLFEKTPALICWGGKDFVFNHYFLEEWKRRLPNAEVHLYPAAGHYVLEDAADLVIPQVRSFIAKHPLPTNADQAAQ